MNLYLDGRLTHDENVLDGDNQEFTVAFLTEKEFECWSATTKLLLIQKGGNNIADEFETALLFQTRYRYARAFESALELYAGQSTLGLGPVALGSLKRVMRKSITW